MKTVQVRLPYFKQGDDLNHFLENDCPTRALEEHATMLEHAAAMLRSVSDVIAGEEVYIDADTHVIQLTARDQVIRRLLADGLVEEEEYEEEEYEEEAYDTP